MLNEKKKEPRMITGVLLLTIAGIAEKILGVILKIPLNGYLGSDGMGYFNSAYNIFSTFYTISITGLPIATSIMISKSRAKGKKLEVSHIFNVSLTLFIVVGIIGSSIMFFGAKTIANIIDKNNNSYYCIQAIAPILLIICISSAIAGITIGHILGMGFLIITKFVLKPDYSYLNVEIDDKHSASYQTILKRMLVIAVPITLSSLALGLTATIDTFTIMNVLNADNAMGLYGDYTTLAVTLYRLPHAFIVPISSSLTPALSAAVSAQNKQRTKVTIFSSIKIASIISIPCSIGMGVLASPIISLLFGRNTPSETIERTAPLLSILSVAIFLMAMLTITSSKLQSYNKQNKPVISMTCGTIVKLILNLVLISSFGIIGAPIATICGYFVMALINFIYVLKYTDVSTGIIRAFIKPLISTIISLPFTVISFILTIKATSQNVATIISILITIVVYLFALFITKSFTKDDIMMLPKGEKIYNKLVKMKLMK